jgi:uncharacterized protein YajQ (UPF0234 family)
MSSAVHDLQAAIVQGKQSLTQLLRQTKLIAAKLSLEDVEKWVDCELKGYPKGVEPPAYREFTTAHVEVRNPVVGWKFAGQLELPLRAIEPIAEIEQLSKSDMLYMSLDPKENFPIRDSLGGCRGSNWNQRIGTPASEFKNILERVKDELLQWTTELEKRGIKGEAMDFNEKEKQSAAKQVFNIGTVHGIVGNATNSQVNIHIANSVNELKVQASAIGEIERALATEMGRRNTDGDALARAKEAEKSLRKAREELEDEAKPDPNRVLKWLEQAKYALKAFGLTKEIIDAGQKLEEAFHLSDWLGSVVS